MGLDLRGKGRGELIGSYVTGDYGSEPAMRGRSEDVVVGLYRPLRLRLVRISAMTTHLS